MDAQRECFLRRIADRMRRREPGGAWRERLREARRLAQRFAEEDPELRQVILFGSLATGEIGDREPKIDLAVESPRCLSLAAIALDSRFKADVIDLATARPAIAGSSRSACVSCRCGRRQALRHFAPAMRSSPGRCGISRI